MNEPCTLLETYAWMGLRIAVPAHWELRRHGMSPEAGALVWVDRHAQRLELRWLRPEKEPDPARMVEHTRDALKKDQPDLHLSNLPSGLRPWQGVLHGQEPRICQTAAYFPDHRVLLQLTFSLEGEREALNRLLREILSSVAVAEDPARATRWRAFGIDCTVPETWTLRRAEILPMDARLQFSCPKRGRLQRQNTLFEVRRLGMVREWFDGNLVRFAESRALGPAPEIRADINDGKSIWVDSSLGRFPLLGGFGPKDREQLKLWHEPSQNAMFILRLFNPGSGVHRIDDVQVAGVPCASPLPAEQQPSRITNMPILEALPVRNQAVSFVREGQGGILRAPVRPRWWTRAPFTWFFPFRDRRGFGLDGFGLEVWKACDGERTVENICEQFARRHGITFQEARVAVCQFLEVLTRRELLVIHVPKECLEAS
ncbi:MAG: PqqD family protein [Verrucomicrobia bacterium]|nr:PqqD family protein [Verrucomicrobiota bacterium]MCH8526633.1 PqqD family protein [Kiritimatiellia bacterium]